MIGVVNTKAKLELLYRAWQAKKMTEKSNRLKDYLFLDWEGALRYGNDNPDVAVDLLKIFFNKLPLEKSRLELAYRSNDPAILQQAAHKLFGALIFCNVPSLRALIGQLETVCFLREKEKIEACYQASIAKIDEVWNYYQSCVEYTD